MSEKKVLRCTMCRRILKECNADPCPGKIIKKEQKLNKSTSSMPSPAKPASPKKSTLAQSHPTETDDELAKMLDNKLIINENTGENQFKVITQLERNFGILGQGHWCTVKEVKKQGVVVDIIIETPVQRFILNDILMLWSDFPKEVQNIPEDERIKITQERLLKGTEFKIVANKIMHGMLRVIPSKFANLKLKLPQAIVPAPPRCPYQYLVVLDLEATCDYSPDPLVTVRTAEVIEFPWLVIDTTTRQFIDNKQIFVKPDYMEGITYYCTKLTGISAETVQNAPKLPEAIKSFNTYLTTRLGIDKSKFKIVTDGVWDIQVQLMMEAPKKGIVLDEWWWKEYFDVKSEFKKYYPYFPATWRPSLKEMLKAFDLNIVGKHHSGIDDCKSIAQVVIRLLELGHTFNDPKIVPKDYDPWTDPLFIDFGSKSEPDAWFCATPGCAVWNRPWMHYCRFCDNKRVVEQKVGDDGFASDEDLLDDPDDEDVLNDY